MRRDIIVIWLLEIRLGEMFELRRANFSLAQRDGHKPVDGEVFTVSGTGEIEYKKLRSELYSFLDHTIVLESVNDNRGAVYRLIGAHMDYDTQIHLAIKLRDYEVWIKTLILQGNFKEVLSVLKGQQVANPQLFYKYASELIAEIPDELIETLIERSRSLHPNYLLFMFYRWSLSQQGTFDNIFFQML